MHYVIKSWNGPIHPGDLERIKEKEGATGKVKFEGIGKFAHDRGYLFNTGSILWREEDWQSVRSRL
jgi:hypothetical protein